MNALLYRLYNPKRRTCGCAPACWCQRSWYGRLFRWWFPGRFFGIHHQSVPSEWKQQQDRTG